MEVILLALIMLLTWVILWTAGGYLYRLWQYREFPGSFGLPLVGNLIEMQKHGGFQPFYAAMEKRHGKTFKAAIGPLSVIVSSDLDVVHEFTIRQFKIAPGRAGADIRKSVSQPFADVVQHGILVAKGPFWGSIKAALQPMFHSSNLEAHASTINRVCREVVMDRLAQCSSAGEPVDVHPLFGSMTLEAIGEIAFGINFNDKLSVDGAGQLKEAASRIVANLTPSRSLAQIITFMLPVHLSQLARKLFKALNFEHFNDDDRARCTMYGVCFQLLQNVRQKLGIQSALDPAYQKLVAPYQHISMLPKETSILLGLMKSKNKLTNSGFTDAQIVQQAVVMILAGYDTTANTLAFAIYSLGRHPAVYRRLQEEVDAKSSEQEVTLKDMGNFPYAEAVIKETLRLFPVVPILSRKLEEAAKVCERKVPAGTVLHFNITSIMHDPEHYKEPERFFPERFLDSHHATSINKDSFEARERNVSPFLAFGSGPRMCLGYRLAMEEGVLALINFAKHYDFELDEARHPPGENLKVKQTIVMKPDGGVWIRPKLRQ